MDETPEEIPTRGGTVDNIFTLWTPAFACGPKAERG